MNDSNLNKLIEISGEGAVILRAICDFDLGDTHYKNGDIVYFFPSCNISCIYNVRSSVSKQGLTTQAILSNKYLNEINLNYVPLTEKLLFLFGKSINLSQPIPIIEKTIAFNNAIFLKREPLGEVRVYTEDGELEGVYFADSSFTIESPSFEMEENYTVLYEVNGSSQMYDINNISHDIPYLSADIIIKGNIDKEDGEVHIHIDRVGINATPVIDMFGSRLTLLDLKLHVVDSPVLFGVV